MQRLRGISTSRVQKNNIRRLPLMWVSGPSQQEIMVGHVQQQVYSVVLNFGYDSATAISSLAGAVGTVP